MLAVAVLGIDNILVSGRGAPEGATRFSTGAHLTFHHYGIGSAALIVTASLSISAWLLHPFRGMPALLHTRISEPEASVFIVAWLSAIALFFLKDSHDHCLVLWPPMLALAARLTQDAPPRQMRRAGQMIVASFITIASVELACNLLQATPPPGMFRHAENLLVLARHAGAWAFVCTSSVLFFCIIRSKLRLR